MQFRSNLTKEEYLSVIVSQPNLTFLQLPAWKEAGESINEYVGHYVGVECMGKLEAVALVLEYRDSRLTMAYVPKGPVLNYENKELLIFFIESLKSYTKQLKLDFIRIEPPIIYHKYNRKNEVTYTSEFDIVQLFKQYGLIHSGYFQGYHNAQPRYTYHLDLTEPYPAILKNYERSVRKAVARNDVLGLKFETGEPMELDAFMYLREQLSKSRHFHLKPKKYFEVFCESLEQGGNAKYYQLSANFDIVKRNLENEIENCLAKIRELEKSQSKKRNVLIGDYKSYINAYEGMIDQINQYGFTGFHIVGITVCSSIGDELLVIYSHTDQRLTKFRLANILYDETIKDAINIGCKTLDFFGIPGIVDKQDPYYGLYMSKKSYGPEMVEYYGYFDYPVHKIKYRIIQALRNRKLNAAKKRG